MTRRDTRGLPAVLASPMLADRLAVELTTAAEAVPGDDVMSKERRGFLAAAAVQVEGYGTSATTAATEPAADYRPSVVRDDVHTRNAG